MPTSFTKSPTPLAKSGIKDKLVDRYVSRQRSELQQGIGEQRNKDGQHKLHSFRGHEKSGTYHKHTILSTTECDVSPLGSGPVGNPCRLLSSVFRCATLFMLQPLSVYQEAERKVMYSSTT